MSIGELRDKYAAITDHNELVMEMLDDNVIEMVEPDPVTGEPMFALTDLGELVFPQKASLKDTREFSRKVHVLWQLDLVEVEFDEKNFEYDAVALTEKAFDEEYIKSLSPKDRETLYNVRRAFDSAQKAKE